MTLYKERFEKLLREIPELNPEEREYVKALFGKVQDNGIEKNEAEKVIKEMSLNTKDNLDAVEVQKIKEKIIAAFY